LIDAAGAPKEVTLPSAIGNAGLKLIIKKIDSVSYPITISPVLGQLIDGEPDAVISEQYTALEIISDGLEWYVI
jgi:hypothetical protein